MKIFLVGATGRTGRWILNAALSRGHEVTALVREPVSRLKASHSRLSVVSGDLLFLPNLVELLARHDAIASALSSSSVEVGTQTLISAAEGAGTSRYIAIAGGGILQLDEKRLRRDREGYPEVFIKSSAGHLAAWKALENSALNWTLICTPDLRDSPATGMGQCRAEYMPAGGNFVALGDVSEFLLDELEVPRFLKKRVGFTM